MWGVVSPNLFTPTATGSLIWNNKSSTIRIFNNIFKQDLEKSPFLVERNKWLSASDFPLELPGCLCLPRCTLAPPGTWHDPDSHIIREALAPVLGEEGLESFRGKKKISGYEIKIWKEHYELVSLNPLVTRRTGCSCSSEDSPRAWLCEWNLSGFWALFFSPGCLSGKLLLKDVLGVSLPLAFSTLLGINWFITLLAPSVSIQNQKGNRIENFPSWLRPFPFLCPLPQMTGKVYFHSKDARI